MVGYYCFGLQKATTEQKVTRHTNDVHDLFIHVDTSNDLVTLFYVALL